MLETAENVAAEAKITRAEQDELALVRVRQYQDALAGDARSCGIPGLLRGETRRGVVAAR
jgi:hypothetical protein